MTKSIVCISVCGVELHKRCEFVGNVHFNIFSKGVLFMVIQHILYKVVYKCDRMQNGVVGG